MQPLVSNFDGRIDGDARHVSDAAAALGVREVEVFRLAYQAWHGEPAPDDELDLAFGGFLRSLEAPYWVRHFCRRTVGTDGENRADVSRSWHVSLPDPLSDSGQVVFSLVGLAALLAYACVLV